MKTPLFRSLEAFPPFLMRVLARDRGGHAKMLPTAILAQRSGLPESYIEWLGRRSTWERVPCDKADSFIQACGVVDLRYLRRAYNTEMQRMHPFKYLKAERYRVLLMRLQRLPETHELFRK